MRSGRWQGGPGRCAHVLLLQRRAQRAHHLILMRDVVNSLRPAAPQRHGAVGQRARVRAGRETGEPAIAGASGRVAHYFSTQGSAMPPREAAICRCGRCLARAASFFAPNRVGSPAWAVPRGDATWRRPRVGCAAAARTRRAHTVSVGPISILRLLPVRLRWRAVGARGAQQVRDLDIAGLVEADEPVAHREVDGDERRVGLPTRQLVAE